MCLFCWLAATICLPQPKWKKTPHLYLPLTWQILTSWRTRLIFRTQQGPDYLHGIIFLARKKHRKIFSFVLSLVVFTFFLLGGSGHECTHRDSAPTVCGQTVGAINIRPTPKFLKILIFAVCPQAIKKHRPI